MWIENEFGIAFKFINMLQDIYFFECHMFSRLIFSLTSNILLSLFHSFLI